MYPDKKEAEKILEDSYLQNSGPWKDHSYTVAECASKIAALSGLNKEKGYVLGLFHDIGRRFGKGHFQHIVDGYKYMMHLAYDEADIICLTHSFPTKKVSEYIGNVDVSQKDFIMTKNFIEKRDYDDYDKLIQLCDALAGVWKVFSIEERINDVEERYGNQLEEKKEKNYQLYNYLCQKCSQDIYEIEGYKNK